MLRKLPCHLLACWGPGLFANTAEGGTACHRPTPLQGDSARPVVPGHSHSKNKIILVGGGKSWVMLSGTLF